MTGRCGIPAGAAAVSANATIVAPGGAGYLALWEGGAAWPGHSTMNFSAGAVLALGRLDRLENDRQGRDRRQRAPEHGGIFVPAGFDLSYCVRNGESGKRPCVEAPVVPESFRSGSEKLKVAPFPISPSALTWPP